MIRDPNFAASLTPEHSWPAAARVVFPVLRPVGFAGRPLISLLTPTAAAGDTKPLIDDGPEGIVVAYVLRGAGYEVLVNGDHMAAWTVPPTRLRTTALGNLAAWSEKAEWTDEREDGKVLISSATGDGFDAARILLPEVRAHLVETLAPGGGRIVVGIPAPDLLMAAALPADDPGFEFYLARFVADYAAGTDDALDGGLFELAEGELRRFEARR